MREALRERREDEFCLLTYIKRAKLGSVRIKDGIIIVEEIMGNLDWIRGRHSEQKKEKKK
jgi:hypothetical protein